LPRARHVVVFARAPRLGAVKTRLARDIGALAALRFYEAMAKRTILTLAARRDWTLWLVVSPDDFARTARRGWRWLPRRARVVAQGRGDLGQRMAAAFARLPPGPAVLVGSDIPGLTAAAISRAFEALGAREAVFGPATDGGYWLVGQRRTRALPDLFANVRWSSPDALADTRANLPPGVSAALVDTLADVDDGAGHAAWRRQSPQ
jgi:hypothetical protein